MYCPTTEIAEFPWTWRGGSWSLVPGREENVLVRNRRGRFSVGGILILLNCVVRLRQAERISCSRISVNQVTMRHTHQASARRFSDFQYARHPRVVNHSSRGRTFDLRARPSSRPGCTRLLCTLRGEDTRLFCTSKTAYLPDLPDPSIARSRGMRRVFLPPSLSLPPFKGLRREQNRPRNQHRTWDGFIPR